MLSIEEITLIKMYSGLVANRVSTIKKIEDIIPLFTEDENEMKELSAGVVRKLTAMNDNTFNKLNLNTALHETYNDVN